jgi:hypothetical protein
MERMLRSARDRGYSRLLFDALEARRLFSAAPSVVGRYMYYGQTPHYGDVEASDKAILLPSQTATFTNVSSYVGGINEIVLDVMNGTGSVSASDFVFRTGNTTGTTDWVLAPMPTSVTTVTGGGVGESDRITVRWAWGSIVNEWLQVNFMPAGDMFYLGSLVGAASGLEVTGNDESEVQAHYSSLLSPQPVTSVYDFNRDGKVDAVDALIAREGVGNSLGRIAMPERVVGRYLYYGNTPYYGDVWASDKTVLLAGEAATRMPGFTHVSSYAKGINEIVLDVADGKETYSAADFLFRVGQGGDPANWSEGPMPLSISTAPGGGVNGSSRIFVRWAAGEIKNEWLEVTFLPALDTFYVGSLVGAARGLKVTEGEEDLVLKNFTSLLMPQPVTNVYDYNRDGKVDVIDALIARDCCENMLGRPMPTSLPEDTAPAAPDQLQAAVDGPFTVELSWTDNATNETGFRIERQTAGSGIWTPLGVVGQDSTGYTDLTAQPHTTYTYLVSAINDKWSSGGSNGATTTTPNSVTRDADGWTLVTPAPDAQIIYVSSSSGDDSNSGTSPASPLRTIEQAKSRFEDGHPAWLLLKCGDTFYETIGGWNNPGTSADTPSIIGSYGTGARPVLATGTSTGITFFGASDPAASHVFLMGLDFYANGRDPSSPSFSSANADTTPNGINYMRGGTDFLIENCRFRYYATNVVIQGYDALLTNFTLRRSVISDAYCPKKIAFSQGIYMWNIYGWTIEENVFDHNGWNAQVSGAEPTIFNHNMYIDSNNPGGTVRNNIVANGAASGIMDRAGGIVSGNLVVNNPVSIIVGNSYNIATEATQVINNVILNGSDIQSNPIMVRGYGIDVNNTNLSTLVQGNIIANAISSGPAFAISFAAGGTNYTATGNVICNWGTTGIKDDSHTATISAGQMNPAGLVDTSRGVEAYMTSLGQTGSLVAFLAAARQQSQANWNIAYTAQAANTYIRQGYVTQAPSNVSATQVNATTVNIVWDAVTNASSYLVERSLDGGGTWVQVAVPAAGTTSFQDTNLSTGSRYCYRITAVNGIGPSAVSLTVSLLLL